MAIFEMKGAWGGFQVVAYERIVSRAVEPLYDRAARAILERNPTSPLLEVGCGSGPIAVRLAALRPDLEIVAVDLSPEMVRRAERRAERTGARGVTFRVGDAMALPFGEASFGSVVSVASIKHWPDQARGVSEIHRVLRPGGRALVAEADRSCTFESAKRFTSGWRLAGLPILGGAMLMYFRTFVAGQSLDLDDVRALMAASSFGRWEVARYEGFPLFVVVAEKRAKEAKAGKGRARARRREGAR